MEKNNITKGPWISHECDEATKEEINVAFEVRYKNQILADIMMGNSNQEYEEQDVEIITIEEAKANAELISEAGTVFHESGLTPRELLTQRNHAIELLKDIFRTLNSNDTTICQALPEHDSFYKPDQWLKATQDFITKSETK